MTRPEEIAHPAEAWQAEPANDNAAPRRPWWLPDPATIAVIVSAAFICALLARIFANRFVF